MVIKPRHALFSWKGWRGLCFCVLPPAQNVFPSSRRGGACPSCLVSEGFHFTRRVSPCGATSFARGGEGGKTPPGVSRGRLTAPAEPLPDPVYGGYPYTLPQKFRPAVAEGAESGGAPDGAVSINKGRADLGSAPPAASENYKKENNGRGEPLPYGVSGKRKQNRGGTGKQKGRSPRTSRGFVLFILIARVCALLSPAHTPAGRPAPPWTWGE